MYDFFAADRRNVCLGVKWLCERERVTVVTRAFFGALNF